jgi:hypothetical protein
MLIRMLATILVFTSLAKTEPFADLIKKTRKKIEKINIFFENVLLSLNHLLMDVQNYYMN